MLITFEGVDGCGKSTQVALLSEALAAAGSAPVLTLREPGGTEAAERVRALLADPETPLDPVAELLLFGAARADLVRTRIEPALRDGVTVICDRFTDSTVAYQGVARGLGAELVASVNRAATGGLVPDRTFYLRLDPGQALARAGGGDRFETEGVEFQRRVAGAYDEIAAADLDRVVVIDAGGDPDSVHARVLRHLASTAAPLRPVTDSEPVGDEIRDNPGLRAAGPEVVTDNEPMGDEIRDSRREARGTGRGDGDG